jgi:spermidine/putrescine transport system substrate-binding protein
MDLFAENDLIIEESGKGQVVAEAQETLRQVQELSRAVTGLAGRIGRTAHETRDNASATQGAMGRIGDTLSDGVAITRAAQQDVAAANAVLGQAERLAAEADRRTEDSRRVVADLAEASNVVEKITDGIANVARQTRLLALNATIEAARAGEYGQGFNVVANEVRTLSVQTADFASEIRNIIGGIQTKIGEVTEVMRGLGQSMAEISGVIGDLKQANEKFGEANRQMGAVIERSAADADEGRTGSARLVTTAEDNNSLIRELEEAATTLNRRSDLLTRRVESVLADFTTLTVLEWEGYFSRFTTEFESFARQRGVEVRLVLAHDRAGDPAYLQGPEDLIAWLDRGGIDIVSPTHSYFGGAPRLFDLTVPLDLARIGPWQDVLPSLREARYAMPQGERATHAVPLLGGSVALAYNARLVDKPPASWRDMVDPRYKGRIGITDGQWETNVYIAAMLAGVPLAQVYDPPAGFDAAIQDALNRLVAQAGYFWGGMPESQAMRDLALVTDYWPGIAAANAEGQDWRFAAPQEGQPVWFDCISITREALGDPKKVEAAYLLIDFMLSPPVQKRILETLGTSIVNTVAGRDLLPEVRNRYHVGDAAFFKPEHLFQPLSPATRARFEGFWRNAMALRNR